MQVENKSAEKDYTFDLDKAFINGLQYDLYMSVDVAPGKKAIEEIDVFGSYLERMKSEGCEQLSDIELCFAVHEMDNFDDEHMMSGSAHVYPYGKDQAMAFDRPSLSSDVVLVDNDYLTILYIGDKTDSDREYGEYTVELFIVSKSDKDLKVDLSEEYINDFLIPSYADISIAAGRSRYASVSWGLRVLDDAGVSEVSSIECIFGVQEDDFWAYEDLATEKVTITP